MQILVISLRYMGDVLLTTPLIRSLARGHPDAAVDVLVFDGAQGMLEGNPDVRAILTVAERPDAAARRALRRQLARRYDLAVVAETGDRPHLYGWAAARQRAGLLPPEWSKAWWKRLLVRTGVVSPADQPRLERYAALVRALGLAWHPEVVAPTAHTPPGQWAAALGLDAAEERFVVLHVAPRFRYKRWHTEGWRALIGWLGLQSLRVVLTGGPSAEERRYVDEVLAGVTTEVLDLTGKLRFAETADLLRLATAYVGPDTATTHLAAACGTPTLALFGPTDPRLWGPVPQAGLERPYEKVAATQRRGNVLLVQDASQACVPCQQEGCDRHRESASDCLDAIGADRVIHALQQLLPAQGGARIYWLKRPADRRQS